MKNVNEIRKNWGSILENFKSVLTEEDKHKPGDVWQSEREGSEGNWQAMSPSGDQESFGKDKAAAEKFANPEGKDAGDGEKKEPGALSGDDFKSSAEKEQDTDTGQQKAEEKPHSVSDTLEGDTIDYFDQDMDMWLDDYDSDDEESSNDFISSLNDMAAQLNGTDPNVDESPDQEDLDSLVNKVNGQKRQLQQMMSTRQGKSAMKSNPDLQKAVDQTWNTMRDFYDNNKLRGSSGGGENWESYNPEKTLDTYRNKINESLSSKSLKKFLKSK